MRNIDFFKEKLKEIDIQLTENQIHQFDIMHNELVKWNEIINLTTIIDEKDIIVKHFIDSLVLTKFIDGKNIIDIGTGAGFPGVPIKIFNDKIKLSLVDTVGKKVNYLKNLLMMLNLENVQAIHARAEDLAKEEIYREKYDIVVSRALANMTTLVEYLLPFAKIGGKVICMKGPNIEEELENSKKAISLLGGKINKIYPYKLKDMETTYNILIIDKEKETPECYPRKAGIPSKKPLK